MTRTFLMSVELDFSLKSRAGETATAFAHRITAALESALDAESDDRRYLGGDGANVVRADISLFDDHGTAEVYTTKSLTLAELEQRRTVAQLAGEWAVVFAYSDRIKEAKAATHDAVLQAIASRRDGFDGV
jgi:hypothetical protein